MSVNAAFTPTGNTVVITAATSAPTAVQAISNTGSSVQYRIINSSTNQGAFLSYSGNATVAQNNAIVANTSVTSTTLYLLPNTDEIMTFVPNCYFTAITSASTATLYITPGDGM